MSLQLKYFVCFKVTENAVEIRQFKMELLVLAQGIVTVHFNAAIIALEWWFHFSRYIVDEIHVFLPSHSYNENNKTHVNLGLYDVLLDLSYKYYAWTVSCIFSVILYIHLIITSDHEYSTAILTFEIDFFLPACIKSHVLLKIFDQFHKYFIKLKKR